MPIFNKQADRGISPTIGIVLMLAIVVVLSSVIGFVLFRQTTNTTSQNANAAVNIEESQDGTTVRVSSLGDSTTKIKIQVGSNELGSLSEVGESMTMAVPEDKTISVVGVTDGGSETVLQTETVDRGNNVQSAYVLSGGSLQETDQTAPTNLSDVLSNMEGSGTESDPYEITNTSELQAVSASSSSLSAHYEVVNNIDASATSNWNSGDGFTPIALNNSDAFTGSLDGNGHTISGLYTANRNDGGLFAGLGSSAKVTNLQLTSVDISGKYDTGGISAQTTYSDNSVVISDVVVTGDITPDSGDSGE